jgi:two-component system, OmpR family, response regulator
MNSSPNLQVLLVEDSSLTTEQVCELIRSTLHTVSISIVDSQKDAVDAVNRAPPHVLVVDLKIREGTGFGVLREVAAIKPKPCIVVLTNYALPKYRELAKLIGADYFLDKAMDFDLLPSVVRTVARNRLMN